jgi:hypothetical protein
LIYDLDLTPPPTNIIDSPVNKEKSSETKNHGG